MQYDCFVFLVDVYKIYPITAERYFYFFMQKI